MANITMNETDIPSLDSLSVSSAKKCFSAEQLLTLYIVSDYWIPFVKVCSHTEQLLVT